MDSTNWNLVILLGVYLMSSSCSTWHFKSYSPHPGIPWKCLLPLWHLSLLHSFCGPISGVSFYSRFIFTFLWKTPSTTKILPTINNPDTQIFVSVLGHLLKVQTYVSSFAKRVPVGVPKKLFKELSSFICVHSNTYHSTWNITALKCVLNKWTSKIISQTPSHSKQENLRFCYESFPSELFNWEG